MHICLLTLQAPLSAQEAASASPVWPRPCCAIEAIFSCFLVFSRRLGDSLTGPRTFLYTRFLLAVHPREWRPCHNHGDGYGDRSSVLRSRLPAAHSPRQLCCSLSVRQFLFALGSKEPFGTAIVLAVSNISAYVQTNGSRLHSQTSCSRVNMGRAHRQQLHWSLIILT